MTEETPGPDRLAEMRDEKLASLVRVMAHTDGSWATAWAVLRLAEAVGDLTDMVEEMAGTHWEAFKIYRDR